MTFRFLNSNSYDCDLPRYSAHRPMVTVTGGLRSSKSIYLITTVLVIGVFITALNVYELRSLQRDHYERSHNPTAPQISSNAPSNNTRRPVVWIRTENSDSSFLEHVIDIFERFGYAIKFGKKEIDWDVMWDHEYPFLEKDLRPILFNLKSHQKVNHVPGSGYYTSKVNLATSNVSGVPPAFSLPKQKAELVNFARKYPEKYWVQKDNNHRGIQVKKIDELNLQKDESFVQEYVSNPLLIDKRKFDIGIYTVITSIEPLRVYTFEGEALLRFCPEDYYPFDPAKVNKYVVHDDYTPVWEMPSLKTYYIDYNYNRKESLNAYLRSHNSHGGDPSKIWDAIHNTIRQVLMAKLPYFLDLVKNHKSPRNFFELSRFDFVVDEDFNVFLMEANMSPNLSSAHFPGNKLLYEQVIYNLLALVGIGRLVQMGSLADETDDKRQMRVSDQDLQVYPEYCASSECNSCANWKCKLCSPCLTPQWKSTLTNSYLEHQNRQNMRRVVPEPLNAEMMMDEAKFISNMGSSFLNEEIRLMAWWFRGKCLQDRTWCA